MAKLLSCVLGPRLYKIYRERDTDRAAPSVPETPTAVPAASSSSWVSRVPPGGEHGTLQTALSCVRPARPLWETGERAGPAAVAQSACGRFPAPSPSRRAGPPPLWTALEELSLRPPPRLLFCRSPPRPYPAWLVPAESGVYPLTPLRALTGFCPPTPNFFPWALLTFSVT